MSAIDDLARILRDGLASDIFLALQARNIFVRIGEHAEQINVSTFQPVFATLQGYSSDAFVLAITRLLDRERGHPLQSAQGALLFLKANASEIPPKEPGVVQQALARLGYPADAFGEGTETAAIVDMLLLRLPHARDNAALNALKALRDKRIAHPERVAVESLPSTTWESAQTLLKIPIEALAICGAYVSDAYVDSEGRLMTDSDARIAAFATLRLLRQAGIVATRAVFS